VLGLSELLPLGAVQTPGGPAATVPFLPPGTGVNSGTDVPRSNRSKKAGRQHKQQQQDRDSTVPATITPVQPPGLLSPGGAPQSLRPVGGGHALGFLRPYLPEGGGAGNALLTAPDPAAFGALTPQERMEYVLARREAIRSGLITGSGTVKAPVVTRAYHGFYAALFVVIAGLFFFIYRLSESSGDRVNKARMEFATAVLRRHRRAAKARLLAAATEQGEIHLSQPRLRPRRAAEAAAAAGAEAAEAGAARCESIRYWSSGPRDARAFVLLHAEDGESAALWGYVHALLAPQLEALAGAGGPRVRLVSFHRSQPAAQGGAPLEPAWHSTPLSLRQRDAELMLRRLEQEARATAAASGDAMGEQQPRSFLLVSQGEGVWGNLATAGSFAAPPGGKVSPILAEVAPLLASWRPIGSVLVSPLLLHRGRRQAWIDALPAASRVTKSSDPAALERLLDPPRLPDPEGVGPDGERLLQDLDRRAPKRKELADASRVLGGSSSVLEGLARAMKRSADPAAAQGTPVAVRSRTPMDSQERRLAEDMRLERSSLPVLDATEARVLAARARTLGRPPTAAHMDGAESMAGGEQACPRVTVVGHGPASLPRFLGEDANRLHTLVWLLTAALAPGDITQPSVEARLAFAERRIRNQGDMVVELSGGSRGALAAAEAIEKAVSAPGFKVDPAAIRIEYPTLLPPPPLPAHFQRSLQLQSKDSVSNEYFRSVFKRLPVALGLEKDIKPSESLSYLVLEEDMAFLPQNFDVTLVNGPTVDTPEEMKLGSADGPIGDIDLGIGHINAGIDEDGLVSLPLQAPHAIAAAVMEMLKRNKTPVEIKMETDAFAMCAAKKDKRRFRIVDGLI
jgi:hypothetical protein